MQYNEQTTSKARSIPILDLSYEIDLLWDDINAAIQDVLRSGRFIMGEPVKQFEDEVAAYLGVKHAVTLNSGTDALTIGLRMLGIGEGDEVITTAFTFFATAESISMVGATPVFVDIDPITFNLDAAQVADAITPRTRVILPVHLFGQSADMTALTTLADQHDLVIFEDVAQAFGATWYGRRLGTMGVGGAFSFFPTKNLGAYGDAGMLVTDDDEAAATAKMLRSHGSHKKYHNEAMGYNSRLDTLQAAILRVKLPYVDEWNAARRAVAARYNEWLSDVPGIVTPTETDANAPHVYHQYTVRVRNGQRDAVQAVLRAQGIGTMVYYPVPIHKLPVYADLDVSLPETERAAQEVLSLPMWPLLPEDDQRQVVAVLRDVMTVLDE